MSDRRPSVMFQPATRRHFQRGVRQLIAALRPTLGPFPRSVLVMPERGVGHAPDMLDSGGLIARRMLQLADFRDDPGAMFVRHMIWRLYEEIGDGTVTAAVLFQELLDHGGLYLAAGGDPMRLRRHISAGAERVCAALERQTIAIDNRMQIVRMAASICYDEELAHLFGEVFDIIGIDGQLEIHTLHRPGVEREYVEGMIYEGGILSRLMYTDEVRRRAELENAALALSDLSIEDPRDLIPVMEATLATGARSLVLVVDHLSDAAIALLEANRRAGALQSFAVRPPGLSHAEQTVALDDIAAIAGGQPFHRAAGTALSTITPAQLGRVRRAWADTAHFGFAGGKGDPRALRLHIRGIRQAASATTDVVIRRALQQRLGRLMGGMATVRVGGATDTETNVRKALAQRTADTLRGALSAGVVPGGGSALLACRPYIEAIRHASDDIDERAACDIWLRALTAPARTIAANAGYNPDTAIGALAALPPGFGLDVRSGTYTDMAQAGVLDSAAVLAAAVRTAASSAALALTIDIQVYQRSPEASIEP